MSKSGADATAHARPWEAGAPFLPPVSGPGRSREAEEGGASPLSRAMRAVDEQLAWEDRHDMWSARPSRSLEESLVAELLADLRDLPAFPTEFAAANQQKPPPRAEADATASAVDDEAGEARDSRATGASVTLRAPDDGPGDAHDQDAAPDRTGHGAFRRAHAARRTALALTIAGLLAGGFVYLRGAEHLPFAGKLAMLMPAAIADDPPAEEDVAEAAIVPETTAETAEEPLDTASTAREAEAPPEEAPPSFESLEARLGPVSPAEAAPADVTALRAALARSAPSRPRARLSAGLAPAALPTSSAAARRQLVPPDLPPPAKPAVPARVLMAREYGPPLLSFAEEPAIEAEARVEAVLAAPRKPAGRDPAQVDKALEMAFGLDSLEAGQKKLLRARLVAGECLPEALSAVFIDVPVLAIRDLVHYLDGMC